MSVVVEIMKDNQNIIPKIFRTLFIIGLREGNGNPLQYSCLENPVDGGAWWAAIYGVAQIRP